MDYAEEQENELMMLESMYMDDFVKLVRHCAAQSRPWIWPDPAAPPSCRMKRKRLRSPLYRKRAATTTTWPLP